jgi:NAD(P)-dependent dehydrogenase (short-subunit alcohol dehydrogenase family)
VDAVEKSRADELSSRVAIVTGSAQGLGRAFAKALAWHGATMVVADLNRAKAWSVVEEIRSEGGQAIAITVNAVLPGATLTEIERKTVTPAQRQAIIASQCIPRSEKPEDLAGTVLFLASSNAEFLTGQSIVVDGGSIHG